MELHGETSLPHVPNISPNILFIPELVNAIISNAPV